MEHAYATGPLIEAILLSGTILGLGAFAMGAVLTRKLGGKIVRGLQWFMGGVLLISISLFHSFATNSLGVEGIGGAEVHLGIMVLGMVFFIASAARFATLHTH